MNPTIELEVVSKIPDELEKAVAQTGLAPDGAKSLKEAFAPHFAEFHKVALTAADVKPNAPKAARAVRLQLKEIRIASDKTRKALKEDSLRRGKAIDGISNVLEYQLVPLEKAMDEIEKAEEIAEAKRIADLAASRAELLRPYADPGFYNLGAMPEAQWNQLLSGAKAAEEAFKAAAAKAEADRIDKEKADAEERARVAAENARLKADREAWEAQQAAERAQAQKERDALELKARIEREHAAALLKAANDLAAATKAKADAEAAKERSAQEAKLKAERDARAKLEQEKRDATLAEQARILAENNAKKKAAAAPDKQKIKNIAGIIHATEMPVFTTPEGIAAGEMIQKIITKAAEEIISIANRL